MMKTFFTVKNMITRNMMENSEKILGREKVSKQQF